MNLGYHRPLAERAVDAALRKSTGSSFEAILKTPFENSPSRTGPVLQA